MGYGDHSDLHDHGPKGYWDGREDEQREYEEAYRARQAARRDEREEREERDIQWPDGLAGKPLDEIGRMDEPTEILNEYDCMPLAFTFKDTDGWLRIAWWIDKTTDGDRYLVALTSDEIIQSLKANQCTCLSVLSRGGDYWVVDADPEMNPIAAWKIRWDQVPKGFLPRSGVYMYPNRTSARDQRQDLQD